MKNIFAKLSTVVKCWMILSLIHFLYTLGERLGSVWRQLALYTSNLYSI